MRRQPDRRPAPRRRPARSRHRLRDCRSRSARCRPGRSAGRARAGCRARAGTGRHRTGAAAAAHCASRVVAMRATCGVVSARRPIMRWLSGSIRRKVCSATAAPEPAEQAVLELQQRRLDALVAVRGEHVHQRLDRRRPRFRRRAAADRAGRRAAARGGWADRRSSRLSAISYRIAGEPPTGESAARSHLRCPRAGPAGNPTRPRRRRTGAAMASACHDCGHAG